jgi:hypothetical protein
VEIAFVIKLASHILAATGVNSLLMNSWNAGSNYFFNPRGALTFSY